MKFLSEGYTKVLVYNGYEICTLKDANPSNGESLNYVIDHEAFINQEYSHPEDAIKAIDNYEKGNIEFMLLNSYPEYCSSCTDQDTDICRDCKIKLEIRDLETKLKMINEGKI